MPLLLEILSTEYHLEAVNYLHRGRKKGQKSFVEAFDSVG